MTTLDFLTEPLVRLFVRIDAAQPTDTLLRAVSDFWQRKREGKIAPDELDMATLPIELSSVAFHATLTINGKRHWNISGAGHAAMAILRPTAKNLTEIADKRIAVRLRRLFELVAERSEPYSAMFEINSNSGQRQLVEVFAAPLKVDGKNNRTIFAAINSRAEPKR
jgi:hypothetical protein